MGATSRRAFLGLGLGALAAAAGSDAARLPDAPEFGVGDRPLAPSPTAMADELCESYAINTKLFYAPQVYGYTDAVIELLDELGVRTVRERLAPGRSGGAQIQRRAMPTLAERGIRWHATVARLSDWPRAEQATREVMDVLTGYYAPLAGGDLSAIMHSLGGCNEVDGNRVDGQVDPNWAGHARLMQAQLWHQAGADRTTATIPVAGPSTGTDITAEGASLLGDLSAISDWGNAHLYNRGGSPSRLIDEQLTILGRCFPDAPRWFFTETGYNNAPQDNLGLTISEEAAATYAVRAICDYHARASIYGRFELLDDPDPIDFSSQETINRTAERQAHFGLVAMTENSVAAATPDTWRKKAEFTATQRFLALMADPGPPFATDPLWTSVAGGSDLQTLAVQKRDGRHYLLLWRDVDVATSYPDAQPLPVPASPVTVRLARQRPVALYSPRHSAEPVAVQPARRSVQIDVRGDLLALEIG